MGCVGAIRPFAHAAQNNAHHKPKNRCNNYCPSPDLIICNYCMTSLSRRTLHLLSLLCCFCTETPLWVGQQCVASNALMLEVFVGEHLAVGTGSESDSEQRRKLEGCESCM